MKRFWTGVLLAVMASASQASLVTEQFTFALLSAGGPYAAGHVFTIAATYDSASTAMYWWNDGPDGSADFGGNDDTPNATYDLSDPAFSSWAFFSEATMSVAGLLLPTGATPKDAFSSNFSIAYAYPDAAIDGEFVLQLRSDDIYMAFELFGPTSLHPYAGKLFLQLEQHYIDVDENPQQSNLTALLSASSVTRTTIAPVPEPPALALFGVALLCVVVARRRNWTS